MINFSCVLHNQYKEIDRITAERKRETERHRDTERERESLIAVSFHFRQP